MERIWSPWRSQYIETFKDESKKSDCFICDAINANENNINKEIEQNNRDFLVVARRESCIIMMNKYPYNSGHTLVAPLRHLSDFEELTALEMSSIMQTIQEVVSATKKTLSPQGFNIGVNVGQAAGAGLPTHLHFHIVPRWNGDSNFMATLNDIKIISSYIEDTRIQLSKELNK
jgi:ATP adenylyltransferase